MTDNRAALVKFGFDTGDYMCLCADCGLRFQGAKRSWRCRPCADEAVRGRAHTDDSANAPRAALVEKVAQAMVVCEGYDANNHFIVGLFKDSAEAAIAIVLEEAARVALEEYRRSSSGEEISAAIRALKESSDD